MIEQEILDLVRERIAEAHKALTTQYGVGYLHALEDVEEDILEVFWREGIDDGVS